MKTLEFIWGETMKAVGSITVMIILLAWMLPPVAHGLGIVMHHMLGTEPVRPPAIADLGSADPKTEGGSTAMSEQVTEPQQPHVNNAKPVGLRQPVPEPCRR
jgi:hypothetical protein